MMRLWSQLRVRRELFGSGSERPETGRTRRRGSVLVIVLVTLMFAVTALVVFMDKATNDLLVDHRAAMTRDLRMEAYSALEVTMSVLQEFSLANGGLHSTAEGWGDPLAFADYTPSQDRKVEIAFEDESGKISLPHATADTLSKLFQSWQVSQGDADMLADALLGWMQRDHVYTTAISPDYEQSTIPYDPPERSLRSYSELAAIDKVRDFFYDSSGQPNDNWRRFVASVSLLDFSKSNINGARPDTLAAVGQYDQMQQQTLSDYLSGKGAYQSTGPGFFKDANQAQALAGPGGNTASFSTTISALRILVTVHDGRSIYRLAAVIAPPNGAKTVQETAHHAVTSANPNQPQQQQPTTTPTPNQADANKPNAQAGATQDLHYPFTLLEIRENDEIPPEPSAETASGM